MAHDPASGAEYRFVVRGELGDQFAPILEGLHMERVAGTTIMTGNVVDQAHLLGLVEQIQELGLELMSIEQTDQPTPDDSRKGAGRK